MSVDENTVGGRATLTLAQVCEVLAALPSGHIVVDAGGRVVASNAVADALFGYEPEGLRGRGVEDLVPHEHRARHASLRASRVVTSAARPMGPQQFFEGLRRDGTRIPLQIGISALSTAEGAVTVVSITDARDAREREHARYESEARFQQLAESIREVFWLTDLDKEEIVYISPAYEQIWGRPRAELVATPRAWIDAIVPADRARVIAAMARQAEGSYCEEYRIARPDGAVRWIRDVAFPVRDPSGRVIRVAGVAEDITERRRMEAQLLQTQKMESVGLLAGGVAHDFNNWLTVIAGNCELIAEELPPGGVRELIDEVRDAAGRAAALTQQLLAFSRRQIVEARDVDLGELLRDVDRMLRRLIGEDVILITATAGLTRRVHADPGLLTQVLMNLAVNARDAMPRGGRLTIEARDLDLDGEGAQLYLGLSPGRHVLVVVSDTGCGMAPEVRARVFEPFFTTKGVGHGTGLGLSVVHGIVAQSGGVVDIYSELDVGTSIKIVLPAATPSAAAPHASGRAAAPEIGGDETVLIVEDEDAVRRIAVRVLEGAGYRVLQASGGDEALALLAAQTAPVALLVTDVVMPRMDGRELAERVTARSPGTRVLYTSGYTDDTVVRHGILRADVAFLQKPYTPRALLRRVREVLDGG